MSDFNGFPKEFFTFFAELKENNNRDWFAANKPRFVDSVVTPMGEFIVAIAPHLKDISRFYRADPKPHGGSMFRIYRDARFSKDKTPYKTHAACHFRHQSGRDAHAPGFYVHFETDGIHFGGGIWSPPRKELNLIRDLIADSPAAWDKLLNSAAIKQAGGIRGDSLKRPPRGFDAEAKHIVDIKRKSFFVMSEADAELALTPELVDETAKAFRSAAKLNQFISDALDLAF